VVNKSKSNKPQHAHSTGVHHIDRRAGRIAEEEEGRDDEVLSTAQVADWLGVSPQWLEIGRGKNYGPQFTRISARVIRYRRADVVAWLKARSHKSTAEYARHRVSAEA
jgi:hypothetical protein